jgi:hypothetical protein
MAGESALRLPRSSWNKGLTAATDPRVAQMARSKTGKPNWARGLTAETDPRIAKNAQTRRGKARGPYRGRASAPLFVTDVREALEAYQEADYVYLLGLYLGDGSLARFPRTYRLEIFLDPKYPNLIEECARAMRTVHSNHRANLRRKGAETVVNSYGIRWLRLFPQHGPGRKHTRPIVLAPWQQTLVERYRWEFLRGCLDSEGSRSRRIVGGKNYPFYGFANESEDIIGLFKAACDRLGLHYTRPKRNVISIARRADVARIDERLPRKS